MSNFNWWCLIPILAGLWLLWDALRGLLGGAAPKEDAALKSKVVAYERDLDTARAELRRHKDEFVSVRADLDTTKASLKEKDSLLGGYETKLAAAVAAAAAVTVGATQLKSKDDEIASLKAAIEASKIKLTEIEAKAKAELEAAKKAAPDIKVIEEANTLRASLKAKDDDLIRITARVNSLASLELQLKDRDLKIKKFEAQLAEGTQAKDDEIAQLKADLAAAAKAKADEVARLQSLVTNLETNAGKVDGELDILRRKLMASEDSARDNDNRLFDLENKLKETEAARKAAVGDKESEAQHFRLRLGELEAVAAGAAVALAAAEAMKPDQEATLRDAEAAHKLQLGEKDAEVARLRLRIVELEKSDGARQVKFAEIETAQAAAFKDKDAAIGLLQLKVKDLEPLEGKLKTAESNLASAQADDEAKAQEWQLRFATLEPLEGKLKTAESNLAVARADHDAQAKEWQLRLTALEPLEGKLKTAESNLAATRADHDTKAKEWQLRISSIEAELGKAQKTHADLSGNLGDWESRYNLIVIQKDEDLAKLRWRIGELEAFVGERESEADKLRRRFAELESLNAVSTEREQQLIAVTASHSAALSAKDDDLNKWRWRVGELEAFVGERDSEADKLKRRVAELENLSAAVAERDQQIASLTVTHTQSLTAKDEDLGKLRWRIGELEAFVGERDSEADKLKRRLAELEAQGGQLATKDQELGQVRTRVSSLEASLGERDESIGRLNLQLRELEGTSADRDKKLAAFTAERAQHTASNDDLLNKLRWRIGELEAFVGERDAQAKAAETQLAKSLQAKDGEWDVRYRKATGDKDAEIARLTARVAQLGTASVQAAAQASAAGDTEKYRVQLTQWETRYNTLTSDKDGEIKRLRLRIRELESAEPKVKIVERVIEVPAPVKAAEPKPAKPKAEKKPKADKKPKKVKLNGRQQMEHYRTNRPGRGEYDDLKLIYGVGPVLEKMLHKLGIYYFKQVATWKEADIEWVDDQMEFFKGRIRREDWLGSAAEEHLKKYGKKP